MMGRLTSGQGQLFYQFDLNEAVPDDHLVRKIDAALDLSWLCRELAVHYSSMGRPNRFRTHRSLNKDAPVSRSVQRTGVIRSGAILGGLHHHYARI
jgi:hypothetical protein